MKSRLRRIDQLLLASAVVGVLQGCTDVVRVSRYEITDNVSGRVYTAEGREINKTAGGVTFTDEAGQRVTLNSYTERRVSDAHYDVKFNAIDGTWQRTGPATTP